MNLKDRWGEKNLNGLIKGMIIGVPIAVAYWGLFVPWLSALMRK